MDNNCEDFVGLTTDTCTARTLALPKDTPALAPGASVGMMWRAVPGSAGVKEIKGMEKNLAL
jgi:hypothetical protein